MYEPLEEMQLNWDFTEPEPVKTDEMADLRAKIDCYLTRRELAPHRVEHFLAQTYRQIEDGLAPLKKLDEVYVGTVTDSDGRPEALKVLFFDQLLTYVAQVVESGDGADVTLVCEDRTSSAPLITARLRFGEGQWSDDISRLVYRHTYDWLWNTLE